MIPLRPPSWWPIVVLAIGAIGCGSDVLLPDPPGGGDHLVVSKVRGDNQPGVVGEQLPEPLVVQVLTARDAPATERRLEFVLPAGGDVIPDIAVTNENGEASVYWVLGTVPGAQSIEARVADVEGEPPAIEFTAEAKAAAPDTLSPETALSQQGRRGQEAATPPVVRVVDRFGNPVAGVSVEWRVVSGRGSVTEAVTQTGVDGTSSNQWLLGGRLGINKLSATVGAVHGSPVTFTASVFF